MRIYYKFVTPSLAISFLPFLPKTLTPNAFHPNLIRLNSSNVPLNSISVSFTVSKNAFCCILKRVLGKLTFLSFLQFRKADRLICKMCACIVISCISAA